MKYIHTNIIHLSAAEMRKSVYELKPIVFLLLCLSLFLITGCASKVSFQIERQPVQQVENIKYIEIGNFQTVSGQIKFPDEVNSASTQFFSGNGKLLKPDISKFTAKKGDADLIADLTRAALVHELSLNSRYQLINTTGKQTGFSGVIPNESEVAILQGKVKYTEIIIESQEGLSYFTNVKNKGATLEQSLLSGVVAMAAESSGAGFSIATPYVEQIAALEVEFSLLRKSDGTQLVPVQNFRTYFVRKWGGSPATSHLPKKIKNTIVRNYQSDEDFSEKIIASIDRAGLSFTNPTEYFARGFNLSQNSQVPQTSLQLKIGLGRQVAKNYAKQISPYHETADLLVQDGNDIAGTLIRGNAYQEAISFLQGLNERTPEDEHNLGLAFEAGGEISQANKHYAIALKQDSNNEVFKTALERTGN